MLPRPVEIGRNAPRQDLVAGVFLGADFPRAAVDHERTAHRRRRREVGRDEIIRVGYAAPLYPHSQVEQERGTGGVHAALPAQQEFSAVRNIVTQPHGERVVRSEECHVVG